MNKINLYKKVIWMVVIFTALIFVVQQKYCQTNNIELDDTAIYYRENIGKYEGEFETSKFQIEFATWGIVNKAAFTEIIELHSNEQHREMLESLSWNIVQSKITNQFIGTFKESRSKEIQNLLKMIEKDLKPLEIN